MPLESFDAVQQHFLSIAEAANAFLRRLSMTGLVADISIAASCAGLALLEMSTVNLSEIPPGTAIFGAIDESQQAMLQNFLTAYAQMSGVDLTSADFGSLNAEMNAYVVATSRYHQSLVEVCDAQQLAQGFRPYVAATTTVKLIGASNKMNLLPTGTASALALFHLIAGLKTKPYPTDNVPMT